MPAPPTPVDVEGLVARMTLEEKVGQLNQVSGPGGVPADLAAAVARGDVGSILNEVDVAVVNELQRIALEESRLGIPLLFGRDVIHGFATIFPIPLGQAASFDPELVRECAEVAAREAAASGIRWTFAPMVDIGRDARWGRVAECLGEDPHLSSVLARAMVQGFQGDDPSGPGRLGTCVKHFAGYGACEAGRDYDYTSIPEIELREVHLPPFKAALDAGVLSFMASFSDLNGVPASANRHLMTGILRDEWGFEGLVVSDWRSIPELTDHGIAEDERDAARLAADAGIDVDLAGGAYASHLADLVRAGEVPETRLDVMVTRVLRMKERLGLFERPETDPRLLPVPGRPEHLAAARRAAIRCTVLLRNEGDLLPLAPEALGSVAVLGPLADDPIEQLGTWAFDGDPGLSVTPLQAIREALAPAGTEVAWVPGLESTRSRERSGLDEAVRAAAASDVALLFLGEEAILSGEAHSRADIRLPGAQEELVRRVAATGTPVVLVLMAGRPLALEGTAELADAVLYAWHPGSMAGPALADLLFGRAVPSGKLPMSLPRVSGQVPIYHARRNSGRPAGPDRYIHLDDFPRHAHQTSGGNTCAHLDAGYTPLFPFGFGLSYTRFVYRDIRVDRPTVPLGGRVRIEATVWNAGSLPAEEVVQLYVRDLVGSVTRPVRELKGFHRVLLAPGECRRVAFDLHTDDLAFHRADLARVTEPGRFHAWIGGDADADLQASFEVVQD